MKGQILYLPFLILINNNEPQLRKVSLSENKSRKGKKTFFSGQGRTVKTGNDILLFPMEI